MTDNTRYVTALFRGGELTWYLIETPPVGLPQSIVRVRIGTRYYFLHSAPPVVDAESGTTFVFVQVLTHHSLWGNNITPEGRVYELTKVDPQDFEKDANWRKIDSPFVGLEQFARQSVMAGGV